MRKNLTKIYAIVLYESLKEASGDKVDEVIKNFVVMLGKRGMLGRSEKIISDFIEYYNEQEGILGVEVTSARGVEENDLGKITRLLEKTFRKKIEITKKIDAGVLGGIILRMKDLIVDGSLKMKIDNLQRQLTN